MEQIVLTPKQQRFCDEYLRDLNATQAALRAGYSGSTALNGNLMAIPKIRYYLQQRTKHVVQKAQVDHAMLIKELCKIAFGNMRNYFRSDGSMKGMHELTDDEAAALWSITIGDGEKTSTKIRMCSKMSAIEKLAKHLNFYYAEQAAPEKEYVYIDKDSADVYDKFDDELFAQEDDEDDDEFSDDRDDIYYPWDSECKLAVAQARAACKARYYAKKESRAKNQESRENVFSPKFGVESLEPGILSGEPRKESGVVKDGNCADECSGYEFSMSEEEEDEYERLAAAQRKRFEGKTPRELAEMLVEGQEEFNRTNPYGC